MVTESSLKSDAEKAAEYAAKEVKAVSADVSKVTAAETAVKAADAKAVSWVQANAGKVVAGAIVLAVLLALRFVWKLI